MDVCTIYLLTNTKNGKVYVGQTWMSCEERMGTNGSGYANSPYIYNAIQKDGAKNFQYTILETCNDQKIADQLEEEYMIKYNSRDHEIGYNIKQGGSAGRHSEETKKKISESLSGENSPWFGKHLTEETKQKLSNAMSGRTLTPEHREQVIQTLISAPFTGHHHTDEARQKISEAVKGRVMPRESVEKGAAKRTKMTRDKEMEIVEAYLDGCIVADIVAMLNTTHGGI